MVIPQGISWSGGLYCESEAQQCPQDRGRAHDLGPRQQASGKGGKRGHERGLRTTSPQCGEERGRGENCCWKAVRHGVVDQFVVNLGRDVQVLLMSSVIRRVVDDEEARR